MKFQFVFGFILLILFFIAVFVGVPYLLQIIKSNQFLTSPRFVSTSTPGYFYRQPQPSIFQSQPQPQPQSQPVIKLGESIYKGKISIASVYRYGQGQINLSAAFSESGSIDITGWKIVSAQRGETVIGRGLALPQFNSFSSDIRLKSGDSAEIIAGLSPLLSNFQVNSCFGWLNSVYNIDSSLNYCPSIQISDLTGLGLDSACQDLILNAGSCRAPSDTVLNNYSRECRRWVEKNLNYNACVEKHLNEADFYKGWRIYTGNNNLFFDQLHDRLELRDQAGLLVNSYEY
jgi:hypothetical protein